MMRRLSSLGALGLFLALVMNAGACASVDKETQITLALESETEIPAELDSFAVRVIATRTGELRFSRDYTPKTGRDFPTTLAVVPFDEDSLDGPLRIEIEARKGGAVLLRRQSVLSYFKKRNILLTLPLRMACFQFKDCGPNDTCAGGQCVPARVDPSTLVDYQPNLVFGEPGACFDEESCLDAKGGPLTIDPADCTFEIPEGVAEDRGNVSIRWAAAPSRLLGLESNDAQEGWTRVSARRGRLSQGACDSHLMRRDGDGQLIVPDVAKDVYFSPQCASKTKSLPYCFSPKTQHAGIGAISPPP